MLPRRVAISGRSQDPTGGGKIEAMDQKLELLSKVPLLAGIDRHGLEAIGRLADEVDLPAGRVAARQGSSGDEFFVILEGTVRIERDGRLLRDLGAGDFFGELALLGHTGRTATATCVTPCRLMVVGHREFHELLIEFPTIQNAVLRTVADRIARLEAHAPSDGSAGPG
jgi:CRP/FNR family transcriptional regulator, cyclic AMP receptor protein